MNALLDMGHMNDRDQKAGPGPVSAHRRVDSAGEQSMQSGKGMGGGSGSGGRLGLSVRGDRPGRSRQISASAGSIPISRGRGTPRDLTHWPGVDADEGEDLGLSNGGVGDSKDEPFADANTGGGAGDSDQPPRTRPERSSSDGSMTEMMRRRSNSGRNMRTSQGSMRESILPTVPASPVPSATSSSNSNNGTPTAVPRGGVADVSDVRVTLDGAGGGGSHAPPLELLHGGGHRPLDINISINTSAEPAANALATSNATTPPPPSPPSRTGVKAVGQGPAGASPAPGSFVESPILIATKSLAGSLFPPAEKRPATTGVSIDNSAIASGIRGILTSEGGPSTCSSAIATVSGVEPFPAAYVEGDGLGAKKALRRVLLPDLESGPEPEIQLVPGGAGGDGGDGSNAAMVGGLPIQFDSINDLCIPYDSLEWAGGEKGRSRVAGGAMGEVYCAEFQGQDVAVKEMKELVNIAANAGGEAGSMDEEMLKDFRAEVELLASCRCPNVVLFVGYCFERASASIVDNTAYRLAVVTEYMPRGSLWDNLHKRRVRLPYSRRMRMLLDVVKGMQYLRHKRIVHCDLKTPNLLVDRQFLVKVADFGLARLHKDSVAAQLKGEYGTPMWMAPEVLMNESFTFKADVYSFGVVIWEVITGKVLYIANWNRNANGFLLKMQKEWRIPPENDDFLFKTGQSFCNSRYHGKGCSLPRCVLYSINNQDSSTEKS